MTDIEKLAQWMIRNGYATGHGDTIEDLLQELEWQVVEKEREACAKLCDEHARVALSLWHKDIQQNQMFWNGEEQAASRCAEAIRKMNEIEVKE